MPCDTCNTNPPGEYYITTRTTGDARMVTVSCEGCYQPPHHRRVPTPEGQRRIAEQYLHMALLALADPEPEDFT